VTQNIVWLITVYGLPIVAANVFVDQIGLPVPAMPTLILAGAIAATSTLGLTSLFMAAVLACIVPDCVWFLVGRRYGMRVLKTLCRISLEPDSCVNQTQSRFERWGVNSLVIAKFVPGLAIIAPPLAGAMRIAWPRFLILSACGGAIWVGAGLSAGVLFKTQIQSFLVHLDRIGSITGTVIAAALIGYVFYKWRQRRRFYKELRMARISVADLYTLMEAGEQPTVVDVRSNTARTLQPQWIPGAIHVPVDDVGRHLAELPRDREIVVYCTCPSEASAARVAKLLINHGFKEVRPLYGGLDAWIEAGYAVDGTPQARS
jgi:membrane protein DedA with SNARE-associated domain/rhodanese-related sulfurtransferase